MVQTDLTGLTWMYVVKHWNQQQATVRKKINFVFHKIRRIVSQLTISPLPRHHFTAVVKLLKPTVHVMHQQFNIQQL